MALTDLRKFQLSALRPVPIPLWLLENARFLRFYILWTGSVIVVSNFLLCLRALALNVEEHSDADAWARTAGGSPKVCRSVTRKAVVQAYRLPSI